MLTHRGFSAWITVEGQLVSELLVAEDAKTARVSCWIPSLPGQNFTVHWKDHGGKVDTAAYIWLDGFLVPGRFLFGEGEASRDGVRSSENTQRPFVFRELEEDEPSTDSANKEVGMITLKIKRIERLAGRPANTLQEIRQDTLGKRKAGEIRVEFGDEQTTYLQYPFTWSVRPLDDGKTYVSFVFRYRSRDWLQMQGIMPESHAVPSSSPKTDTRRISSAPAVPIPDTPKTILMTPRESPDPTPPKKKQRGDKPSLQGKSSPAGRARKPSADLRRTASYQIPATRQASMEHVFHFEVFKKEEDAEPDWKP